MSIFYKIRVFNKEIKTLHFVVFSNILFITLYILLSYFNRISIDDFYFLNNVNKYGIIEGTSHEHETWSGRWAAVLVTHTVLFFYKFRNFLFVYQLSIFLLFSISAYRLLKNIDELFTQKKLSSFELINISILLISALFYTTFKIDETWFWLCASSNYLLSIIFLILGSSAIIAEKKSILNIALCIVSFTYIGGSCEPLGLFVMLILVLFVSATYFKYISLPLPNQLLASRLLLAFVFCLSSFILMYSANGNRVRENFFEDISLFGCFILNFKTTGMIILLRLPAVLPYLIPFSFITFYLGAVAKKNNSSKKAGIKKIILIGLTYFVLLFIYQFPVSYITQDIAAYRALFPITLLTLIFAFAVFYQLGLLFKPRANLSAYLLPFVLACIITLNTFTLYSQSKIVPNYAKAYDVRIAYLLKQKDNFQSTRVKPLPSSGLLFSAEISSDSAHFSNLHLQSGLHLKAGVVLSKDN